MDAVKAATCCDRSRVNRTGTVLAGFTLAFLATARVTRFLNSDVLAEPIRLRVQRWFGVDSKAAYLVECPWCTSIWVAPLPVAALLRWWARAPWPVAIAAWLGCSWLTGIVSRWLDNDD